MRAVLLLLAGIPFASANAIDATGEYSREETSAAYDFACQYVRESSTDPSDMWDCPPPPAVLTTPTRPGLWGFYYRGSAVVWVSDTFQSQPISIFAEGVIMHEMVHYILSERDLLQSRKDSCRNENMAWSAYNTFVIAHGRDVLINEEWWTSYSECGGPEEDRKLTLDDLLDLLPGSETLSEAL